jgi:hypothetical protein
MAAIKPGMMADITLEGIEAKGHVYNFRTMIYDVIGRNIIVSQTSPPIRKDRQQKELFVTFLAKKETKYFRYGFRAALVEFLADYEIASSRRVPALVLEQKSNPEPHNLRMNFRIKPISNNDIAVSLQGGRVNIIDISLGGVRISTNRILTIKPRDIVKLKLSIDGGNLEPEGMVISAWASEANDKTDKIGFLQYATISFLTHQKELEAILGRKILHLERKLLAYGRKY